MVTKALESSDVEEIIENEKPSNGLFLSVGEELFACRKISVSWHMMQFGHAQREASRIKPPHKDGECPGPYVNEEKEQCKYCAEASDQRSQAGMDLMAAMRSLILKVLKPEERDRFIRYMDDEAELKEGELEEAIGDVLSQLGGQDKNKDRSLGKH